MITNVDAVTVFNGRTDKATRRKIYTPTVIRGVSYVEGKGSKVADNGVWSDDVQYKIRVPLIAVVQDNREYMRDLNYAKLDNEEAAKYWTIQKGDLVVRGEYAGDSPLLGEDEISAYSKEQGLDLIRVTEYADDTSGGSLYTRHWRIGGK
ncbi:DUF6751 family protein [Faecalibaculum rodentium]|uniref:DUF6751 family protein n=1 Tax=Faecalibaculum rodentium TaxID=1702221 RepID=UPI00261EF896|nr:DUF6751 family protein [Faecalibaculum rodentium]